jgi:hypothetical protein
MSVLDDNLCNPGALLKRGCLTLIHIGKGHGTQEIPPLASAQNLTRASF